MSKILKDFDKLYIKKISGKPKLKENYQGNIKLENKSFIKQGLYNGSLLGCISYKRKKDNVILNCQKFKFFDYLLNRTKIALKIVHVDIIIKTKDKYFIMIKRDGKVSTHKYYWDFPAGLLPFDVSAYKWAVNRMKDDTNIKKRFIELNKEPKYLMLKGKTAGLFYMAKCKLTKKELEKSLGKTIFEKSMIFFKRSKINSILKNNKKVYPREILRLML